MQVFFADRIGLVFFLSVLLTGRLLAEEPQETPAKPVEEGAGAAAAETAPASPSPERSVHPAAELLQKLSPENQRTLAEMLERDWADRPEWAEMALAILRGESMRPGMGWWGHTEKKYGWTWIKRKYDQNSDSVVERHEFPKETPAHDVYFKRLDRDLNGKIETGDFDVSVFQQMSPAAMQGQVAEMLTRQLDADSNGQVTKDELVSMFDRADQEKTGFLTAEELLSVLTEGNQPEGEKGNRMPNTARQISMFFTGQLGWFDEGPKPDEVAPDFSLTKHDGSGAITLSEFRGKKPVVLIFGSFT